MIWNFKLTFSLQVALEQSQTDMDILVTTLSSPVSSSGYGSAEEDHSLVIPFPDLSTRRYAPLSPSSDSGSGIFSFPSASSSSVQSAQDDLLPETLGTIFGDLLEFEDDLPHLDLSCGLNFSDNRVIAVTNERKAHMSDQLNDIMVDHTDDRLNDPSDFDCLSDLCHYFHPDDVDSGGCDNSTNIDPTSSIDLEEERGSEESGEGPEDRILVFMLPHSSSLIPAQSEAPDGTSTTDTRTHGHSMETSNSDESCPVISSNDVQDLPNRIPNDVEVICRPFSDCQKHPTSIDSDGKATKETETLFEGDEMKSLGGNSFTTLFELISSGTGKSTPLAVEKTLPKGLTRTELSGKKLPQKHIRCPPDATLYPQPKNPALSRTFARGQQVRSLDAGSPSQTSPASFRTGNEHRKSVSLVSHDPTLTCPLGRTAGVRRSYSELDDHRYSTTAPEVDPAPPPSKTGRTSSQVADNGTGKSTGSCSRVTATGGGHRRSEKTILETFLLTTEKLYANKGSDAMLAEDSIAQLYCGRQPVLSSGESSFCASHTTSSSSSSASLHRSSVLERLLTEGGRSKQESNAKKDYRKPTTTHHGEDAAIDVRHAVVASAATPGVSNSMYGNYEQFENSHFAQDSITLQLGLLTDELNPDHVWTPSSVDDKVNVTMTVKVKSSQISIIADDKRKTERSQLTQTQMRPIT